MWPIRLLRIALLAGILLSRAIAAPGAEAANASIPLARLAARYYEAQVRLDPINSGTIAGDNRFDDRLPIDIAPAQRKKRFAMYHRVQRALAAIRRDRLSAEDALTHDLLTYELRTRLGFEAFDDHLLPLQQMDAVPIQLANFGSGQAEQPLKTVADHDAYLKRIERLPAWATQATANMREGMRRRVVQPRPVVLAVLAQLKALGREDLAENPFFLPIQRLPASCSLADRQRLTAAYGEAVGVRIAPALRRLAGFVENEYLPASRETAGWSDLPNGAAWYRQWVRSQTTTDLSPEDIHAMGLREVARIQAELARLAPRLGYQGEPGQLLAWVRTNPGFMPFHNEAEVLDAYRGINDTVKAHLPRLFKRMPRAALDIRPEPELTRATASNHYTLPAEDGSRPGIFWAVIDDAAAYNAGALPATFLHEGQPGHHFQLALQQEMALPAFRKRAWINAYGEGWALYAETLGTEMGLYDDPVARVGELKLEISRAARLVVDTGMHALGWSRARVLAYLVETVGLSPAQAQNQADRYMAWPAQALGYKLGSLKIQALRERAQQRLGARFSLAAFHDAVLAEGSLPLSILEARIERWIKGQV